LSLRLAGQDSTIRTVAGENGEVAVVTFGDHVTVVQDFTRDADKVDSAFAGLKAGDNHGEAAWSTL